MNAVVLLALIAAVNADIGFGNCKSLFYKGFEPYQPSNATQLCKEGVLAIGYDNDMVNPAFTIAYTTPTEANSETGDRLSFKEDLDLQAANVWQAPVDSKVFGTATGYDRGHLTPSNIMSYNKTVLTQCYYMSNLSPQQFGFNRGVWSQLEGHVTDWIGANGPLFVVTGVGYKDRSKVQRPYDNVAIPDYFYKVISDPLHGNSAGFYGENVASGGGMT